MDKKNLKNDFEDGFKKSAGFFGIHSVGDLFKFALKGGVEIFKAIINLASRW